MGILSNLAQKIFPVKSPLPNYVPEKKVQPFTKKEMPSMMLDNYNLDKQRQIDEVSRINRAQPRPLALAQTLSPTPTPKREIKVNVGRTITMPRKPVSVNSPTAPVVANPDYLESQVLSRTRKYNIPDAVAAGQWAAEGRFVNPQNNNWYNLMSNGSPHHYENLDTHTADYALTVKNLLKNQGIELSPDMDAMDVLRALQSGKTRFEGHEPDPTTYVNLVSSTPEFKKYYKPKKKK